MANRFWVGGSGNWDATTTHWSTSSGGANGASAPTVSDDVFFDSNSGLSGATVTTNVTFNNVDCKNFTATTGVSWTITDAVSTNGVYYNGNLTLESGLTVASRMRGLSSVAGNLITINGATINSPYFEFMSASGSGSVQTWVLQDNLVTTGEFNVQGGTFDANGKNVTARNFYFYGDDSIGSDWHPTINMGSGTWTVTGDDASSGYLEGWAFDVFTGGGGSSGDVVLNASTSTLKFTNSGTGTKSIAHYVDSALALGRTYSTVWFATGNTGASQLKNSNSIAVLKDTNSTGHSFVFTAGITITINRWQVSGNAGNLITLQSSTTAAFTLTKSGGGQVSCDYLSISYSTATPTNNWYAGAHSTNGGNNTGWRFRPAPNFFMSA